MRRYHRSTFSIKCIAQSSGPKSKLDHCLEQTPTISTRGDLDELVSPHPHPLTGNHHSLANFRKNLAFKSSQNIFEVPSFVCVCEWPVDKFDHDCSWCKVHSYKVITLHSIALNQLLSWFLSMLQSTTVSPCSMGSFCLKMLHKAMGEGRVDKGGGQQREKSVCMKPPTFVLNGRFNCQSNRDLIQDGKNFKGSFTLTGYTPKQIKYFDT